MSRNALLLYVAGIWPIADSDKHVFMSTEGLSTLCPFTQTWYNKPRLPRLHHSSFVCCLSLLFFFIHFPFPHVIPCSDSKNDSVSINPRNSDIGRLVFSSSFVSLLHFHSDFAVCTWVLQPCPVFDLYSHRCVCVSFTHAHTEQGTRGCSTWANNFLS